MAVGDLASVKIHMHNSPVNTECAFGVQAITSSPTWRNSVAAEWYSAVAPTWRANLAVAFVILHVMVSDIVPGTAADVVVPPGFTMRGLRAAAPAPINCAGIIGWRTAHLGRAGRGRMYMPGLVQQEMAGTANSWSGSAQAIFQAIGDAHLAQWGPSGISSTARLVVISRQQDGIAVVPPVGHLVNEAYGRSQIGSQRRRARS